jgi:hypothetical protein
MDPGFSFGPFNFREQPATKPPENDVREVVRQETASGCLLLGVCGSPRDGLHYTAIIGWASCRTPPTPVIGDWHAELRYPQPSDALMGIGIVLRKEDVAERHFDETPISGRTAGDVNPRRAIERPAIGDWHAWLRSSYEDPDHEMIGSTPGVIVRWGNTENTFERHFDESPQSADTNAGSATKFTTEALNKLPNALREMEDDSYLFGGFAESGENFIAGSICVYERPHRMRAPRSPDFGEWRAKLRCWDLAVCLLHGGSIVDHHLNGIRDGHFDEEPLLCDDIVGADVKNQSGPFEDFLDLVRQSEATGYFYDGRDRQDGHHTGNLVFIGFWR